LLNQTRCIKIEKIDKKNTNLKINDVDEEIRKIRSEISSKSEEILDLVSQLSKNESSNQTINKKIYDLNLEISKLRIDLQEKKIERENLLILLNS